MSKKRIPTLAKKYPGFSDAEIAEAMADDRAVARMLRDARNRSDVSTGTEKSVLEGAAFMEKLRAASEAAVLKRIKRRDLLTRDELVARIGGNRGWVTSALKSERLFSVQGPNGCEYYPAFFAVDLSSRRVLGKVAKALAGLPGPSKYFFFVSKSFTLQMTPLEALARGRLSAALIAASGFATR